MNKHLIIANWKSNGSSERIIAWCHTLVKKFSPYAERHLCICPPYIYLHQFHTRLISALPNDFPLSLGAQDISAYPPGAHTGEINGAMLKENGCRYVLVGHSERRNLFNESTAILIQKMQQASENQLRPVFCLGESRNQYEAGQTGSIIKEQLNPVLDVLNNELCHNLVIAYEPVWAIGTGLAASPQYADDMHALIKEELAGVRGKVLKVLYGGSINAENAYSFLAMPNIEGLLVGGASLDARNILKIYES